MKYYIEYYRHRNDKKAKLGIAMHSKESLLDNIENSRITKHVTICYFIVKLKNHESKNFNRP